MLPLSGHSWSKEISFDKHQDFYSMSRYWIRLPEIADFVISCLEIMQGGEIFVPKMEERALMDIAQEMYPECEIKIIGKSDIERVHERLFAEHEEPEDCGSYWVVK